MGHANHTAPPYNTVVTNIPGPQEPLYMCGAKMVTQYGVGMVHDAMGLMHAIVSYYGDVTISITSDREMMRDPDFYGDCIEASHGEYAAAAGSTSRKSPAAKSPASAKSSAANTPARKKTAANTKTAARTVKKTS
jgi:hypothetical protein